MVEVVETRLLRTELDALRLFTLALFAERKLTEPMVAVRFEEDRLEIDAEVEDRFVILALNALKLFTYCAEAVPLVTVRFWMDEVVDEKLFTTPKEAVMFATPSVVMDVVVDTSSLIVALVPVRLPTNC
jgi:hypothetical protein